MKKLVFLLLLVPCLCFAAEKPKTGGGIPPGGTTGGGIPSGMTTGKEWPCQKSFVKLTKKQQDVFKRKFKVDLNCSEVGQLCDLNCNDKFEGLCGYFQQKMFCIEKSKGSKSP